jgi:acetyltransferase-like isoleucine patch superfamily enzyme
MFLSLVIRRSVRRIIKLIRYREVACEDNVEISPSARIFGKVEIGRYTYIAGGVQIDKQVTKIGRYCSIATGCKLGLGPHPVRYFSTCPAFYDPSRGLVSEMLFDEFEGDYQTIIGHDVWIGTNAIIMAGVNLGNGAIIGAGSVVTKDVPPYAIVVGVPAKIIRYRFEPKLIEQLDSSRWWEKSPEWIAGWVSSNQGGQHVEAFVTSVIQSQQPKI